ncbi:hypothetical protein TNIN_399751 [Trichonephila inaurata madagascariensis]|uniref:Uncharacterized protein n=1 Tax=Trichonephila inaurata madagascariensis TaxID=2747483 RepID=A0A8X6XKD1_9ARAC|nr:hypothetical protein TNIN_399751 [Trichonephila inaurata madagascariensis]
MNGMVAFICIAALVCAMANAAAILPYGYGAYRGYYGLPLAPYVAPAVPAAPLAAAPAVPAAVPAAPAVPAAAAVSAGSLSQEMNRSEIRSRYHVQENESLPID